VAGVSELKMRSLPTFNVPLFNHEYRNKKSEEKVDRAFGNDPTASDRLPGQVFTGCVRSHNPGLQIPS
jgi:hypothetical protein